MPCALAQSGMQLACSCFGDYSEIITPNARNLYLSEYYYEEYGNRTNIRAENSKLRPWWASLDVSQPYDIYVEIRTLVGVSVCKQKRGRGLLRLMLSKLHQSATEDVARGQDLGAVIDVLYI